MSASAAKAFRTRNPEQFGLRTFSSLVIRVSGLGLIFGQAVLLARLFNVENYGFAAMLLSGVQILSALTLMGLGPYAIVEVPRQIEEGKFGEARGLLHFSRMTVLASSAFLIILSVTFLPGTLTDAERAASLFALFAIPAMAFIQLHRGHSLANSQLVMAQLPGELLRPLLLMAILAVALAGLLTFKFGITEFFAAFTVTAWIAAFVGWRALPRQQRDMEIGLERAKRWMLFAMPFYGTMLVNMAQLEAGTVLLGILASPEAAGLYYPLAKCAFLLALPAYVLGLQYQPDASRLTVTDDLSELLRISQRFSFLNLSAVMVGGGLIGVFAVPLLSLFGPAFSEWASFLWVLVGGAFVYALSGPAAQLLTASGYAGKAFAGTAVALAVELALLTILIPRFGLGGAVWAVAAAMSLRATFHIIACQKYCGLGPAQFFVLGRAQ
ncbi:lipopolysaccharide biosynthesis protein [Erythrobacter sp.]|jgi:O-antigen/teichoic acid export membrane protein|uniref:lipopolysaccharide biosynthesis protein n=1 Tax=Erythrobacter sp. TaxID=1042 RepID=UPI002EABAACF|nr:polysaccharide biosynthesis C-terminal domain-containing protein [Erythrobacter sp.]